MIFRVYGVGLLLAGLAACSPFPRVDTRQTDNNICLSEGGQQVFEQKRGDGVVYQVCLFSDNRQCELKALIRGECPRGGLKITGYITEASRYCVLTGGFYIIKPAIAPQEQGYCIRHRVTCDAGEYFHGRCLLPSQ